MHSCNGLLTFQTPIKVGWIWLLYDLLNHKTSDTLHYPLGGAFQTKNAMSLFAMVYWHFKCLSKWVGRDYTTSVLWFSSQEGRLPRRSQDDKRPKKPDESISTIGWCRHVKVTVYRVTPCGASVNNGKAINASTNLTLLLRVLHFSNQKQKQLGVNKLAQCTQPEKWILFLWRGWKLCAEAKAKLYGSR